MSDTDDYVPLPHDEIETAREMAKARPSGLAVVAVYDQLKRDGRNVALSLKRVDGEVVGFVLHHDMVSDTFSEEAGLPLNAA